MPGMLKPAPAATSRAPRVKLAGTVLSLVCLENGRQVRAKVHQLSLTGGLLQLEQPLDEGITVEVMFHVGESTVRSPARVLFPMWATQGCLQPFQFEGLSGDERSHLQADLQKLIVASSVSPVELPNGAGSLEETGHSPEPEFPSAPSVAEPGQASC
jgi:hypothetical protein